MKLKDIVAKINKSPQFRNEVYIEDIAKEFGLEDSVNYNSTPERLTSYYFNHWFCTDKEVGYKVYFLDDIAVAVSYQL